MQFTIVPQITKRGDADILVFPFWKREKKVVPAAVSESLTRHFNKVIATGDFEGKKGETLLLYLDGVKEKRVLLLGLGKQDELSVDALRDAYSNVAKECQKKSLTSVNLVLPTIVELRKINLDECLQGVAEGILLTNYRFEKLVTVKEETVLLKNVSLVGVLPEKMELLKRHFTIAEGVYFARDLINENADLVTPEYLAQASLRIAKKFPAIKATLFDRKRIEKEQMGLLLAVGRGASVDPAFIQLSYKGDPKNKEHTIVIGKGVTFDTGGLNLKPTGSMETMRADMSGAAAALATIATVAALGLKINLTVLVAAAENAIDANSYKPGDVYKSYSGVTVEIGNTDAEGRLTLADALSYAIDNLKPTAIIDFATLTGSIVVALGEEVAGLFCNQDELATKLIAAGEKAGEHYWRMPLYAPYKEQLKSDIADLKNVGGRPAGSITAALFLQEFVGKIPWAHIDIAGTAFAAKEQSYNPKYGVGFGVRTMIEFFQLKPKTP